MDKKGLIGLIVVVGILLVVGFVWFVFQMDGGVGEDNVNGCNIDADCVPASCCHASECVLESEAPDCSGRICTMNCEPGTLDCGQGHCEFVDGECEVVWDE